MQKRLRKEYAEKLMSEDSDAPEIARDYYNANATLWSAEAVMALIIVASVVAHRSFSPAPPSGSQPS